MSLRRVRPWDVVLAVLGVILWALLGVEWYELLEGGATAREAFGLLDVLLILLGLLAVLNLVVTAAARRPAVPLPVLVSATALAALLSLAVLYRILNQPGRNADVDVSAGAWLGLACVLATLYAAYRALRDESAPGVEPPPPPERRPAPAAGPPAGGG